MPPSASTIACSTCGLKAQFCGAPDGRSTTQFDSGQFRAECKVSANSATYECPDLAKAVDAAVWDYALVST